MTYATEVSVIDIGMGGVSLTADKRLNIGARYQLKLEGDTRVVSVTCEVAWSRMSGTRKSADGGSVPVYTAGMKFVGVSPDSAADLLKVVEAVVHDAAPPDNDRRAHSRFPPKPPGIALLDLPSGYSVKTISLSGMLIESAEALALESRVPMIMPLHDGPDIDFVGRVVSCVPTPDSTGGRYDIGIEFVDLTDAARRALAAFIQSSFGQPLPGTGA
jgi:hypothetical protein